MSEVAGRLSSDVSKSKRLLQENSMLAAERGYSSSQASAAITHTGTSAGQTPPDAINSSPRSNASNTGPKSHRSHTNEIDSGNTSSQQDEHPTTRTLRLHTPSDPRVQQAWAAAETAAPKVEDDEEPDWEDLVHTVMGEEMTYGYSPLRRAAAETGGMSPVYRRGTIKEESIEDIQVSLYFCGLPSLLVSRRL